MKLNGDLSPPALTWHRTNFNIVKLNGDLTPPEHTWHWKHFNIVKINGDYPHLHILDTEACKQGDHCAGLLVVSWHCSQEVGVGDRVTKFYARRSVTDKHSQLLGVRPQIWFAYYYYYKCVTKVIREMCNSLAYKLDMGYWKILTFIGQDNSKGISKYKKIPVIQKYIECWLGGWVGQVSTWIIKQIWEMFFVFTWLTFCNN